MVSFNTSSNWHSFNIIINFIKQFLAYKVKNIYEILIPRVFDKRH